MMWAILALLGVPFWLCAIGILALLIRNRGLRLRAGNVPVRVLQPGRTRWTRAHGVWVSDAFAWREARPPGGRSWSQWSQSPPRPGARRALGAAPAER